jgi:hypothetical protein
MKTALRHRQNVGREDRLVRACVALSLLLLGGFSLLAAGRVTAVAVGFVLAFAYFALTAAAASDPFYARQGIDTRSEVPHEVDASIDADPFAHAERGTWPEPSPSADPSTAESPGVLQSHDVLDLRDPRTQDESLALSTREA